MVATVTSSSNVVNAFDGYLFYYLRSIRVLKKSVKRFLDDFVIRTNGDSRKVYLVNWEICFNDGCYGWKITILHVDGPHQIQH